MKRLAWKHVFARLTCYARAYRSEADQVGVTMKFIRPSVRICAATLCTVALLVLCLPIHAAQAQGSVGFVVAPNGPINDTASGLCVDEMAEVVRLDGRMTTISPISNMDSCTAFQDSPGRWAECAFVRTPTVAMRVVTELKRDGYMLDVRYVTASGDVLENRVTVDGELRDLLYRCRMRAAVLVEALFGNLRVPRELLDSNHLLAGDRYSRRRGAYPPTSDDTYVWQQYPGDRVGDFSPRRDGYVQGGYGHYTEGRDNRVGDYLPNRSGESLGPPYLPTSETDEHPTSGYFMDEHTTYRRDPGLGYFILEGGDRAYYDLRPRRSTQSRPEPRADESGDESRPSSSGRQGEGRYLESR